MSASESDFFNFYHIKRVANPPGTPYYYSFMTYNSPLSYFCAEYDGNVAPLTAAAARAYTDEIVTIQLPRSHLDSLIASDQYSRQRDYRSIYGSGKVSMEEEHWLRRNNSAVAKAYAHYQLMLELAKDQG